MEASSLSNAFSRRRFLELVGLGVPVAAALAACSSTSPGKAAASGSTTSAASGTNSAPASSGGSGGGGKATYWFLSGQPQQKIRENAVKGFNAANAGSTISYTEFQNDAYKTKIKTAIGAGQSPTIIWGWGGGGLRTYVKDGVVEDPHGLVLAERGREEPAVPELVRRGHDQRQDLCDAVRDRAADRPVLEQENLR